eukprot:2016838-Amphidinium_carterae.1
MVRPQTAMRCELAQSGLTASHALVPHQHRINHKSCLVPTVRSFCNGVLYPHPCPQGAANLAPRVPQTKTIKKYN